MSKDQGIGVVWPLASLVLAVAAMLAPAPAAAVVGVFSVAALAVPIIDGLSDCLKGSTGIPCDWMQPERETPCECSPATGREPEPPSRRWAETTARDTSASRYR